MKTLTIFPLLLCFCTTCYGQSDTIFFSHEKIVCSVKEITTDAVKYIPDHEEVTNAVYKNAVHKIAYKDGKVQTFAEAAALRPVNSLYDYNNVTVSRVESEVHGLYKLGEVGARARGGSAFGSRKMRERAERKLKILAAMKGANMVYLTDRRNDNYHYAYYTSYPSSTSLLGVAYSNEVPSPGEFQKALSDRTEFTAIQETILSRNAATYVEKPIRKPFKIEKISSQNGLIVLDAHLEGEPKITSFRVVSLSDSRFNVFYEEKGKAYNVMLSL